MRLHNEKPSMLSARRTLTSTGERRRVLLRKLWDWFFVSQWLFWLALRYGGAADILQDREDDGDEGLCALLATIPSLELLYVESLSYPMRASMQYRALDRLNPTQILQEDEQPYKTFRFFSATHDMRVND
jgi:hypothetical protein